MNTSLLVEANSPDKERCIGLASIKPQERNDILGVCCQAFVSAVNDVKNKDRFTEYWNIKFAKLDFNLVVLDDVETLDQRVKTHKLPDELETAIENISSNSPVPFGTFQAY